MSLFLLAFYYVVIPLMLLGTTASLMRKADGPALKMTVLAIGIGLGLGLFWLAIGRIWWVDYQVKRLCAKDGGIKVYERVEVPEPYRDRQNFDWLLKEKPTDEYFYVVDRHYYIRGMLQFVRRTSSIVRRKDDKVLGISITYSRSGGMLPGPWAGSSYICPDPVERSKKGIGFESSVFITGGNK